MPQLLFAPLIVPYQVSDVIAHLAHGATQPPRNPRNGQSLLNALPQQSILLVRPLLLRISRHAHMEPLFGSKTHHYWNSQSLLRSPRLHSTSTS